MPTLRTWLFPYGMEQNPDGTWIVFNRRYKPLGITDREHVDYMDPRYALKIERIGPATLAKLDINHGVTPHPGRVYFYREGSIPEDSKANMDAYVKRMSLLMKLCGDRKD